MSVAALPPEILCEIFKKLDSKDIETCGEVCERWKAVVDSIPDDFWMKLCAKEHSMAYKEAHKKTELSWRELCTSLNLWPEVKSAEMRVLTTGMGTMSFEFLRGGVIAIPTDCYERGMIEDVNMNPFYGEPYDSVLYYDSFTYEKRQSRNFNFPFSHYQENENIILLLNKFNVVCVVAKATLREYIVGKLTEYYLLYSEEKKKELVLLENEVYFKDKDSNLIRIKLTENNGEIVVETENLGNFSAYRLLTAIRINEEQVNILTATGLIVAYKDNEFYQLFQMNNRRQDNIYHLENHGFSWTNPSVYMYLSKHLDKDEELPKALRNFSAPVCTSQGDIIVIGTLRRFVHIFKIFLIDQDNNGVSTSKNYRAKKILSINLGKFDPETYYRTYGIRKITVVERENGHDLFVAFCSTIYIIELLHKVNKRKNTEEYEYEVKKYKSN